VLIERRSVGRAWVWRMAAAPLRASPVPAPVGSCAVLVAREVGGGRVGHCSWV
jgi:hypothetical protein